jgi:hypothetical protein
MASNRTHYVSNEDLFKNLMAYQLALKEAKARRQPLPRLPDAVGEAFLKIADRLVRKPNFASYTFREDMVADAVENCCQYVGNFDAAESKNPFSYFTQIIYFAFLRRINREKKHLYVKYKAMEFQLQGGKSVIAPQHEEGTSSGSKDNLYENIQEFIHAFEFTQDQKKRDESTKAATRRKLAKKEPKSNSRIKNHLTMFLE